MKQYGFVYLLGNEWMPHLYKIGCTERSPHSRAAQLSEPTGVPAPFQVLCYIEVDNHQAVERELHEMLDWARVTSGREFFYVEDFAQLVGHFRWHPSSLAFTDCGAGGKLADDMISLSDCPDPWQAPAPAREAPMPDFDFPFERPLRVVAGGQGA